MGNFMQRPPDGVTDELASPAAKATEDWGAMVTARAMCIFLLLVVADFGLQVVTHGGAEVEPAVDMKALVRSLESPDCRVRKAAVLETWRHLVPEKDPTRYLKDLREAVNDSRGDMRRRLALIDRHAEAEADFWQVRWKELFFVERLRTARSLAQGGTWIEDARKVYLAIIRDPN